MAASKWVRVGIATAKSAVRRWSGLLVVCLLVIGSSSLAVVGTPGVASASTSVTLYVDQSLGTTSTCFSPGAGACTTIQQGLGAASGYPGDDVTIEVAAGTYTEQGGYINIGSLASHSSALHSLTIQGTGVYEEPSGIQAGTVIDGSADQGFYNTAVTINGGDVTLSGLAITDGYAFAGGGVSIGYGASLTMTDDEVYGNIAGYGCLDIINCGDGGGVLNFGGTLTATDVTFYNNSDNNEGGAVWNEPDGPHSAVATLTDDTFISNASLVGNAVSNDTGSPPQGGEASMSLTDDTFSGNTDFEGTPGGADVYDRGGTMALTNDTLADGSGQNGNPVAIAGPMTVSNSIVNGACGGAIIDGGYNDESTNSCGFSSANGDLVNSPYIDLASGGPATNGSTGPETVAIPLTSSAAGLVPLSKCTTIFDERGAPRPGDPGGNLGMCDAGAFEAQREQTETGSVLAVNGSRTGNCSTQGPCPKIQQAIDGAQAIGYDTGAPVTIDVAAGTYTENLSISAPAPITIQGADSGVTTVDGSADGIPDLTINTGTVTLNGMSLVDGSAANGGGIYDYGTLTLNSVGLVGDSASGDGGAIFSAAGHITVSDSTVASDYADDSGGGIYNIGLLTINASTISGDGAGTNGGGILSVGSLTLTDSTVSGNTATQGGGIFNEENLTLTDSTVSGNTGANSGGGVDNYNPFGASTTASVGATIVAANSGGNCAGPVTSVGYNLTDDTSRTPCSFTQPTDVVNANPELGPLGDNGGPTETMLPASHSPAVGRIQSSPLTTLSGVQVCPRTDQRGVMSTTRVDCTIGAVEVAPTSFGIATKAPPNATPGSPYGPITLQAEVVGESAPGYATTLKWKKVSLPKGLKLSSAGQLSGTPNPKLIAGPSSITVEVTETVTTFNGTKKVKTKTTVESTIPLTIT